MQIRQKQVKVRFYSHLQTSLKYLLTFVTTMFIEKSPASLLFRQLQPPA